MWCSLAPSRGRFSLSQAEHPQPLRTALQAKYPDHRHVFVPLMNVSPDPPMAGSRGDLQLRLDAMRILQDLQVEPEQLLYAKGTGQLSCVGELRALHQTGQLRLILVDHNEYRGRCLRRCHLFDRRSAFDGISYEHVLVRRRR